MSVARLPRVWLDETSGAGGYGQEEVLLGIKSPCTGRDRILRLGNDCSVAGSAEPLTAVNGKFMDGGPGVGVVHRTARWSSTLFGFTLEKSERPYEVQKQDAIAICAHIYFGNLHQQVLYLIAAGSSRDHESGFDLLCARAQGGARYGQPTILGAPGHASNGGRAPEAMAWERANCIASEALRDAAM
ncbi:hypothetical protein PSPO01_08046 [Paraphaeosphaeria sporulosa]